MVSVDNTRCNGCGYCVDLCPQKAITIDKNVAVIHQEMCIQCGICVEACPAGAIRELVPAQVKLMKGGERMMYGYGRGFGFRGASPSWPYVGRGRGGLPRCWHPGLLGGASYTPPAPYWPAPVREEELGFLNEQADVMKSQLEDIERRIQEMKRKD